MMANPIPHSFVKSLSRPFIEFRKNELLHQETDMTPLEYSLHLQQEIKDKADELQLEIEHELKLIDERQRICIILAEKNKGLDEFNNTKAVIGEYEYLYQKLVHEEAKIRKRKEELEREKPEEIPDDPQIEHSLLNINIDGLYVWRALKALKGEILLGKRQMEDLKEEF
jgi:hypothetical protein